MLKHLPLLLLLCAACSAPLLAQVVRLENLTGVAFEGWHRTTIDKRPPHRSGIVTLPNGDVHSYVVGRAVGLETMVLDVHVHLDAGQHLVLDLATSVVAKWTPPGLPQNPLEWFGGVVSIGGQVASWVSLQQDGAGWDAHFRARTGPMLCSDVWLTWYPGQGWASGEVLVTASNPTTPDMGAAVPPDFRLAFGDALVLVPGRVFGASLLDSSTWLADGQARALPFVLAWPRHLHTPQDWSSMGAEAALGIGAVGISRLLPDGNPTYPPGFDARAWAAQRFGEAIRRLHTWDVGICGPNRTSNDTGAQEDQVFVRGEAMLPGGVGAERVTYLSALKMANRPCHHLEADGSQIEPARHVAPRLICWDGRAHWHTGVSPDQLGKPRGLTASEASGWWGPDVEHWLGNTLAAGVRYTGSPALQWLLSAQARIYLLQWTTTPGWSTSSAYAARSRGWEGIMAVHLFRELEDRALAERVKAHWLKRAVLILGAADATGTCWDIRTDDPRLGPGDWWIPWQTSVGAYGFDLACAQLGPATGRAVALAAAKRVLQDAWVLQGTTWLSRAQMPVAGGGAADGSFNFFGMALSIATVRRHEPENEGSRAIWQQLQADGKQPGQTAWLAPGVH